METMINTYKDFWVRYVDFQGLSSRPQYWYVVLINFILGLIIAFLPETNSSIYGIATFIPGIALTVKRLHDTDRS
ncbi:Inner membrane protein YhaI [Haloplasma contractile SSD-17B]|uniref:Inner membrane protein YhaI n=2 Tax=Haloplasma TaxID=471824 RepID=U2EBS5_9MOLU|nr:Inner membrane protein YhaI [Haloplasma contractile SSD-17B]